MGVGGMLVLEVCLGGDVERGSLMRERSDP